MLLCFYPILLVYVARLFKRLFLSVIETFLFVLINSFSKNQVSEAKFRCWIISDSLEFNAILLKEKGFIALYL